MESGSFEVDATSPQSKVQKVCLLPLLLCSSAHAYFSKVTT